MSVRTYLRTPAALAWTLAAIVGVAATVAAGWQLTVALASSTAIADAAFLDGIGAIVLVAVVAVSVLAVAAAVWLPCSAAIAYAVGRRYRGRSATIRGAHAVVRARSEPLYRWVKTLLAVGAIADRLLTENDVAPTEVAAGCGAFVVPAIVLDAPTLPSAVDRANRVVPSPGRRRIQVAGVGATAALAAGCWGLVSALGELPLPIEVTVSLPSVLFLAVSVVGLVITAAVDVAWRAATYADADTDAGFVS